MTESTALPASLSLHTYLHLLRRQWGLILAVTVLTVLVGSLPSLLQDPVYASTATLQVSPLDRAGVFDVESEADLSAIDRGRDLATELEVISSSTMEQQVREALGDDVDFGGPGAAILGYANAIEIRITANDPAVAADVANTYAEVFLEDRRGRSVDALVSKAEQLREEAAKATEEAEDLGTELLLGRRAPSEVAALETRQSTYLARALEYERRADELSVEASLRGAGTEVLSAAEPESSAISPQPLRAATVALVIGVLLGLGVAVLVDTLEDKLSDTDDLASVRPDLPVLASVPQADPNMQDGTSGFAMREAFRYLHMGLRVRSLRSPLRSVVVTSAVGGEGKTTAVTELAWATAELGERVVAIDCDLRHPGLHERFDLPNDRGLSSVVLGDDTLADVIHFVDENLAVVTAGPKLANPPEVLGSDQFARLLASVVEQADLTIVDSPPVLPVADALIIGQLVDGTVTVCRIGEVRRRQVRELFKRLDNSDLPIAGIVANDVVDEPSYGYYQPNGSSAEPHPSATSPRS